MSPDDADVDETILGVEQFLVSTLAVVQQRRAFATWIARPSAEVLEEADTEVESRLDILCRFLAKHLGIRIETTTK